MAVLDSMLPTPVLWNAVRHIAPWYGGDIARTGPEVHLTVRNAAGTRSSAPPRDHSSAPATPPLVVAVPREMPPRASKASAIRVAEGRRWTRCSGETVRWNDSNPTPGGA